MIRGDLYRVRRPADDPRTRRVYLIVSRQALVDSKFPMVVCAPVHSERHGLASELAVGSGEGLKHDSSAYCDALVSVPKRALTDFVGRLSPDREGELHQALRVALGIG